MTDILTTEERMKEIMVTDIPSGPGAWVRVRSRRGDPIGWQETEPTTLTQMPHGWAQRVGNVAWGEWPADDVVYRPQEK